jgi:hypothetical protein
MFKLLVKVEDLSDQITFDNFKARFGCIVELISQKDEIMRDFKENTPYKTPLDVCVSELSQMIKQISLTCRYLDQRSMSAPFRFREIVMKIIKKREDCLILRTTSCEKAGVFKCIAVVFPPDTVDVVYGEENKDC